MHQPRRLLPLALTLATALFLTSCGLTPRTTPLETTSTAVVDTSSKDFTADEAKKAEELNQSGLLESKEIPEYEEILGRKATEISKPAPTDWVGGTMGAARLTRIGYVRAVEGGKYLLVLNGTATRITLTGVDGKRDRRIEGYLNHKVILRGVMLPKGELMVEHILAIPSFNFITDFFFKGRLAGTVFLDANRQGLVGALVVAKAGTTGFLYRTQTDRRGNWTLSGLEPDRYTLTVGLGGFKGATQEGVYVLKGKKTSLMVPMNPN